MDELNLIRGVLGYMFGSLSNAARVAERCHMGLDDFEQVGRIAIWKASNRYIPQEGSSLEKYAFGVIRFEVLKEIRRKGNFIAIPHNADFNKHVRNISSLNVPFDEDTSVELQDIIPGEAFNEDSILDRIIVDQKLKALPKRARYIIARLIQGETQNNIGKELGISQMQVSRIYQKTLNQLKEGISDETCC